MCHRLSILLLLLLVALAGCESDPSKDSDHPANSVPLDPSRSDPSEEEVLSLRADLKGQYVKGLEISGGNWNGIGPRATIEIEFTASGMSGIGQFDIRLATDPPTSFDVDLSRFVPEQPFVTMGAGVEQLEDGTVRFVGADLRKSTNGTAVLGTLRLLTKASFTKDVQVRMPVSLFSIGPSMAERDDFEPAALDMGIVVNGE